MFSAVGFVLLAVAMVLCFVLGYVVAQAGVMVDKVIEKAAQQISFEIIEKVSKEIEEKLKANLSAFASRFSTELADMVEEMVSEHLSTPGGTKQPPMETVCNVIKDNGSMECKRTVVTTPEPKVNFPSTFQVEAPSSEKGESGKDHAVNKQEPVLNSKKSGETK